VSDTRPERRARGRWVLGLRLVAALGAAIALVARRRPEAERPSAPTFVGGETCAPCHADETRRWAGSHHDRAMEVASEQSVLGDFDGASFSYGG